MRAALCSGYGPPEVVRIADVAKPAPGENELLVRIRATTVTAGDRRVRSLDVPPGLGLAVRLAFGIRRPRQPILGSELAGEVESVGRLVTRFKPGDAVVAFDGVRMGCHAEYRCVSERGAVVPKPAGLSFEAAAALPFGGTTALDFFRRARLRRGERVLVNGASGAVGTAAVQLARELGADVTGVCSGANAALVRSLGANRVIDYTQADFARGGDVYDVIVDAVGNAPLSRVRSTLAPDGRLLAIVAGLPAMLHAPWVALTSRRRVLAGPASERREDLSRLAELAAAALFRPVIDRRYTLARIVDAHRYVDTGRKRGNVVVTLDD